MSKTSKSVAGLSATALGVALLAWVLYDASNVREVLRLEAIASEATVALSGLAMGLVGIVAGSASWRRARASASIECS